MALFAPVGKIFKNAPPRLSLLLPLCIRSVRCSLSVQIGWERPRACALLSLFLRVYILSVRSNSVAPNSYLFRTKSRHKPRLYLCLFLFLRASCYVLFAKFSYNARTRLIDFSVAKKCRTCFGYKSIFYFDFGFLLFCWNFRKKIIWVDYNFWKANLLTSCLIYWLFCRCQTVFAPSIPDYFSGGMECCDVIT